MTNFEKVKEFHKVFNCERSDTLKIDWEDQKKLKNRVDFIEEELSELCEAIAEEDIVEVADALTDILYFVYGFGDIYGIDLDACFEEIHRSNMTKLGKDGKPILRKRDGKIMKPDHFEPPNLNKILFKGAS